jgi:hypothetical protein
MEFPRLISAIVRQTTVLVARLSTTGGVRSPLAQVADQVFLGLVTELERQGLSKKVTADMFGLALRSYQLKLQRLQESISDSGMTLWAAVRSFIDSRGAVSRSDVLARFARDDEASVRGILNDLVESGLVSRTGRGDASIYRITPKDDLASLAREDSRDARTALVWLTICRDGPLSRDAIARATELELDALEPVLSELIADARVQRNNGGKDQELFSAERCLIPIGDAAGWEAALLDHHQAVLNAIAGKISAGSRTSANSDETGGSTFGFELWPGHPDELAVRSLLAQKRAELAELWTRVSQRKTQTTPPETGRYNVTFYLGQHVLREDLEQEES